MYLIITITPTNMQKCLPNYLNKLTSASNECIKNNLKKTHKYIKLKAVGINAAVEAISRVNES